MREHVHSPPKDLRILQRRDSAHPGRNRSPLAGPHASRARRDTGSVVLQGSDEWANEAADRLPGGNVIPYKVQALSVVDLATAGRVLRLGHDERHNHFRRDESPVPVLRFGLRIVVARGSLLDVLDLNAAPPLTSALMGA
jgi:hypothetical protein